MINIKTPKNIAMLSLCASLFFLLLLIPMGISDITTETLKGFYIQPADSKMITNVETVVKNGINYELLCKATEIREVKKVKFYNCEKLDYNKPIYKIIFNITTSKEQNIINGYEKIIGICEKTILVNETFCIKNGEVKVGEQIISSDKYFCGAGVCDNYKDSKGGGGDGNGDGICQAGETCINYENLL